MTVHKASPSESDLRRCEVCGQRIKRVPGGNGPTYVHSDSGAVAAPNPPTWQDRRTSTLTLRDAMALGDIIRAASQTQRVVWVVEGRDVPSYGTVRHIVSDPETAGLLRADADVRDAWLRITTDAGLEWFVPMHDIVARMRNHTLFFNPEVEL